MFEKIKLFLQSTFKINNLQKLVAYRISNEKFTLLRVLVGEK